MINNKYEINLPRSRQVQHDIWTEGNGWETERLDALHDEIEEGDVVYDVGAELGDFTTLFALWGAEVGIIEPSVRMWPSIKTIWNMNVDRQPLFTFTGFASDLTSGFVNASVSNSWPNEANGPLMQEPGFCHLDEQRDLPQVTIDDLAGIHPPDILTIDIEGSELACLHGARKTLRERTIRAVFVSIHPGFMRDRWGHTPQDLLDFMSEVGYTGEHLATDHEEHWKFTIV